MTNARTRWPQGRMVAFDTETTGTDVESDRIVSAALVAVGDNEPPQSNSWLLDPGIDIPAQATEIHGISTARARTDGASATEAIEAIAAAVAEHLIAGMPLVVFNARYDLTLLDREARRHGLAPLCTRLPDQNVAPVIDPLVIDKKIDRFRRGPRRLAALAAHYRVRHDSAHNAEADALTAARLAWRIGASHDEVGAADLLKLHDAQTDWAARQAADLESYLRRTDPQASVEPAWPYIPHTLTTETAPKEATP